MGRAGGLLLTLVLMMSFAARPAQAQIFQCGTKGNYHAGYSNYSNDPNNWEGTSATILVRKGAVCDTDRTNLNTSSAWTMIAPMDVTGWAQSGHLRWYGSSIYHFAQYRKDSSTNWVTKIGASALATGSSYRYWQQSYFNSAAGQWRIRSNVNSTVLLETNWNTFSVWNLPFQVSWSGETNYTQSDVPGSSSAKTRFSNMQVQRFSDDQWTSVLPAVGSFSSSTRYKLSSVSANAFDMWTG